MTDRICAFCRIFTLATLIVMFSYGLNEFFTWRSYVDNKKEPYLCNDYKGIGTIFYKFKKLNILYTDFPSDYNRSEAIYPPFLAFDKLSERIVSGIKKNFRDCMKMSGEEDKPVEVILYRQATPAQMSAVHDPDNLTLVVNFNYGVAISSKTQKEAFYTGIFGYFFYRPEVKYLNARFTHEANSLVLSYNSIPFEEVDRLERLVDLVISSMKPYSSNPTMPPSWVN